MFAVGARFGYDAREAETEWTGLREEERSGIARIGSKNWSITPSRISTIRVSFITITITLFLETRTLGNHNLFHHHVLLGYCLVCDCYLRDDLEQGFLHLSQVPVSSVDYDGAHIPIY